MAKIEALEEIPAAAEKGSLFRKIWQPVFVTVSVAIAIFIGIMAGSFYSQAQESLPLPEELVYLDDAAMESLSVFMNE